jgi:antitoxin (DNA-binding transcriptional repressor) of toxin-antitoxin stability system
MLTYTLAEAKAKFSQVVKEVQDGDSALITKHGYPVVLITQPEIAAPAPQRGLNGFLKKKFEGWQMPEDFDRMAQSEIIAMFEDGDI